MTSVPAETALLPTPQVPVDRLPIRVVLLNNFIAPHKRPIYVELAKRVEHLTLLLSTSMEANRRWHEEWEGLDVRVSRTTTLNRTWNHPAGFRDEQYVHIPWSTIRELNTLKPDVIISTELGSRSLFSALYKTYVRRVPLIYWLGYSEHTERGRGFSRRQLRKWLLRRADRVVANGASGVRYLQQLGLESSKIVHSPHPTLPVGFDRAPLKREADQAHRMLYVGQLIQRKGLMPFVEALSRWARDNPERKLQFDLVGTGPLETPLRNLSLPANLNINLRGQCDYATIAQSYATSGVFVFPSLADDWGMAVSEAMTSGLPVLGSVYSQAVEETCCEGETGWPFRTDVPSELDRAIDLALRTPVDQLNRMRATCRDRISHLTPERSAENFIRAIQACLDEI